MTTPLPTQDLFIVRITQTGDQAEMAGWHGSARHVASGMRLAFASLDDLNDFIHSQVTAGPPAPGVEQAGQPGQARFVTSQAE
jgi:hypothetical protein